MHRKRELLCSVILAAHVLPAWAQPVTSAGNSVNLLAGDPATIPNLSGTWGHYSFPGIEPPATGPGPVLNKSRRRQSFDDKVGPTGAVRMLPWWQQRAICRRLQQSDPQAAGGGSRKEIRRNRIKRSPRAKSEQPVLAQRGALCVLESRRADPARAGQGHDHSSLQS